MVHSKDFIQSLNPEVKQVFSACDFKYDCFLETVSLKETTTSNLPEKRNRILSLRIFAHRTTKNEIINWSKTFGQVYQKHIHF